MNDALKSLILVFAVVALLCGSAGAGEVLVLMHDPGRIERYDLESGAHRGTLLSGLPPANVVFEDIRAIDCGDDGISAHGASRYRVDGFASIGNATGICDTGNSETSYRGVFIDRCIGFDLYFLDTGRYSVTDAYIRSSAVQPFYLLGRDAPAAACRVTLDNVWLERVGSVAAEVRVSPNCRLSARRSTFTSLDVLATGGEITLDHCVIGGEPKPNVVLWPTAIWRGENNLYDLASVRVDKTSFTAAKFADFKALTASDVGSRWEALTARLAGVGADESALKKLPLQNGKTKAQHANE